MALRFMEPNGFGLPDFRFWGFSVFRTIERRLSQGGFGGRVV